jgi:hypothetical protein
MSVGLKGSTFVRFLVIEKKVLVETNSCGSLKKIFIFIGKLYYYFRS